MQVTRVCNWIDRDKTIQWRKSIDKRERARGCARLLTFFVRFLKTSSNLQYVLFACSAPRDTCAFTHGEQVTQIFIKHTRFATNPKHLDNYQDKNHNFFKKNYS